MPAGIYERKPQPILPKFLKKVNKTSSCWLWTGAIQSGGYGNFWYNSRIHKAHRVSYILFNGLIPSDLCVLHKCDVRNCVNPDHLFLGTYSDNNQDCHNKGRYPTRKGAFHHWCKEIRDIKGEKHPRALLTNQQVIDIRHRYALGGILQRDIAKEYGVTQDIISHIITRRSYKEI